MVKKAGSEILDIQCNGMTLDELNINGVQLIAFKSYRNRLKVGKLVNNG